MHRLSEDHRDVPAVDWRETDDRLLLWPEVRHHTGVSRTTAWRMERTGGFPARVQLSPGRVGWWESEVTAWKMSRRLARLAETARGRRPKSVHPVVEPSPPAASPSLQPHPAPRGLDSREPSGRECQVRPTETRVGADEDTTPVVAPKPRGRAARVAPGQMGFDF